MAEEYTMPKLGHLMEDGTVMRWFKQVGEPVAQGELLLEVESDKALVQVESPFSGVLLAILVEAGQKALVGAPLAIYGRPGERV